MQIKIKEIATGLRFPEGPVAMPDGSVILVEIARGTLSLPDGFRASQATVRVLDRPEGRQLGMRVLYVK